MKKLKVLISILLVFLLSSCGGKITLNESKNNSKNVTESTVNVDSNSTNISSADIKNIKVKLEALDKELAGATEKEVILKHLDDFKEKSGLKISSVYFGDEGGKFYVTPIVQLPGDYDPRIRPWYKSAKEDGEFISDAYVDLSTNNKILSVSKSIYKNKDLIGVVGIDLVVGSSK